jgi:hypothetical protein
VAALYGYSGPGTTRDMLANLTAPTKDKTFEMDRVSEGIALVGSTV